MPNSKLIRQLSLLSLLLNRSLPVDWEKIRTGIEGYGGEAGDASARRKFERDKADLRKMGIAIETVGGDDKYEGYRLKGDAFYLPELKFTKSERRVLNQALAAILSIEDFPLRSFALSAQKKLIFDFFPEEETDGHIVFHWSEQKKSVKKYLALLNDAIYRQKRITMTYYAIKRDAEARRTVDPYGLMFREGIWYLIGHDHLRKEQRVFRLERIKNIAVNGKKPETGDFEVPDDFSMKRYMGRESWRLAEGEGIEVTVRFDPEISPIVARRFAGKHPLKKAEDGSCSVTFMTTQLDALIRYVMGFRRRAEIVSPESARKEVLRILSEMREVYA